MITSRKISQVKVFAGSPWEVASVKSLLNAAYIQVSTKDNGLNSILISVPCEYYTAAMRVINNRKVSLVLGLHINWRVLIVSRSFGWIIR